MRGAPVMESKKIFGDYILLKRKEAGLTQKSFAEKLFVTESAVSKWERGVSYPDISLIKDICEILGVSERELLTASEDTQTRTNEKVANRYMKLIQRFKRAQIMIYGLILAICFICNLAAQHSISWFFIVLTAVMVAASLTLLPVLVEKSKRLVMLGGFTLSLLLLLLVCNIYYGGSWFILAAVAVLFGLCVVFLPKVLRDIWLPEPIANHTALLCMSIDTLLLFALLMVNDWYTRGGRFLSESLPIAIFWIIAPWGMLLIHRYTKINKFYKIAASLALTGLVFYLSKGFTTMIIEDSPMYYGFVFELGNWNLETLDGNLRIVISLLLLALTVVFAFAGVVSSLRRSKHTT